jgi:hypothetical protein
MINMRRWVATGLVTGLLGLLPLEAIAARGFATTDVPATIATVTTNGTATAVARTAKSKKYPSGLSAVRFSVAAKGTYSLKVVGKGTNAEVYAFLLAATPVDGKYTSIDRLTWRTDLKTALIDKELSPGDYILAFRDARWRKGTSFEVGVAQASVVQHTPDILPKGGTYFTRAEVEHNLIIRPSATNSGGTDYVCVAASSTAFPYSAIPSTATPGKPLCTGASGWTFKAAAGGFVVQEVYLYDLPGNGAQMMSLGTPVLGVSGIRWADLGKLSAMGGSDVKLAAWACKVSGGCSAPSEQHYTFTVAPPTLTYLGKALAPSSTVISVPTGAEIVLDIAATPEANATYEATLDGTEPATPTAAGCNSVSSGNGSHPTKRGGFVSIGKSFNSTKRQPRDLAMLIKWENINFDKANYPPDPGMDVKGLSRPLRIKVLGCSPRYQPSSVVEWNIAVK